VSTLAVSQGRNEDKWSKVQPLEVGKNQHFNILKQVEMQRIYLKFYAPKAQKELDQSLFRDFFCVSALADCDLSEKGLQVWIAAATQFYSWRELDLKYEVCSDLMVSKYFLKTK